MVDIVRKAKKKMIEKITSLPTIEMHVHILDLYPFKYLFFLLQNISIYNFAAFTHRCALCTQTPQLLDGGDGAVLVFATGLVVTGTHVFFFFPLFQIVNF